MASAERIFGVLDAPEEVHGRGRRRSQLARVRGKIEFRHVWFAYHDDNWVLRTSRSRSQPGEKVAIVGATGAGKSTMMALLSRFYDVQRGEILVDDVPIRQLPQRDLRRHVGLMLQDPFVYTDTVEENIRLRDPSIPASRCGRPPHAGGRVRRSSTGCRTATTTMLAERGGEPLDGPEAADRARAGRGVQPGDRAGDGRGDREHRPRDRGDDPARHPDGDARAARSIVIAHRLNTIRR